MAVRLCEEHPSCYQVLLRNIDGPPAEPSDEWHFGWSSDQGRWRLKCPARNVLIDRDVPDGVSPTVALLGAIPGAKLSHIGKQIEKLGFPPPDRTTDQPPDMSPE